MALLVFEIYDISLLAYTMCIYIQAVRYESDLSVNESFGFETAVWIKVIYRMSTHVLCISMSSCQDFSHVTISHVLCFVELLQFARGFL